MSTKEEIIVFLHNLGDSVTEIRKKTGYSYDKVTSTLKQFVLIGQIPPIPKIGRKSKQTNQFRTVIATQMVQNRGTSVHKMSQILQSQGYSVSATTVWRGIK